MLKFLQSMDWPKSDSITGIGPTLGCVEDKGKFTDVKLIVGQGKDARKFNVHRLILAMYSRVMEELFDGEKATKEEIVLEEDDPHCFGLMIRFLYCHEVKFSSVEEAILTCYLAEKYDVREVEAECVEFLLGNIRDETALQIYEVSIATDELHLRRMSWMHIVQNTTNVLASPSFGEVGDSIVQRIVGEEYLTIASEVEIYKALRRWGRRQCEKARREATAENMRSVLEHYLPEVRFLSLSKEELVKELGDVDVLGEKEQLCIINKILEPGSCDLPKVCSPRRDKRKPFPKDSSYLRFKRDGKRSLSRISGFREVKETLEVAYDVCIFGVEFYISTSDSGICFPAGCQWILSIWNLSNQQRKASDQCFPSTYINGSDKYLEFTIGAPVYLRKGEVCEITLEGNWEKDTEVFCCTGDCYSHPYEFASPGKESGYHFHAIYAVPV